MKPFFKRGLAAVAVVLTVAGLVPLLNAAPAAALGSLQGAATINNPGGAGLKQSGDSSTPGGDFTLRLPAGAACPGDSANENWKWQTYMVSGAINPDTLQFGSTGPTGQSVGTYATFKQPLYTPAGSIIANRNTVDGTGPGTPGPIVIGDDMSFSVFEAGNIPAGVYNLGIACTNGGASATQMSRFWNVQMTISTNAAGGPAQITWQNGTAPAAPTITGVTSGAGQLSVAFTLPAGANPALTNCHVVVATSAGGAEAFGGNSATCTSPIVVSGLTNGTPYFVRMFSTNAVGNSANSNEVTSTPSNPAVTGLVATPVPNGVNLDWDNAAGASSYDVARCTLPASNPCASGGGNFVTANTGTSSLNVAGLVPGQVYTFTITYGPTGSSGAASVQATPLSNSIVLQDITVGRPNGALVLTQVCGKYDAMDAEVAQLGFPAGLPASAASTSGVAPTTSAGGPADAQFGGYPYPDDPTTGVSTAVFPTHCGVALGQARFVRSGAGAGNFFAASGRLSQVTIVDTRDTDPGWTVNMQMSQFSAGPGKDFSGNQLGYTLKTVDNPAFTDGSGFTYNQTVVQGADIAPNTAGSAGAGTAHAVISVPDENHGLGIALLDARIKVLIPVHEQNGTYTGVLTINAL